MQRSGVACAGFGAMVCGLRALLCKGNTTHHVVQRYCAPRLPTAQRLPHEQLHAAATPTCVASARDRRQWRSVRGASARRHRKNKRNRWGAGVSERARERLKNLTHGKHSSSVVFCCCLGVSLLVAQVPRHDDDTGTKRHGVSRHARKRARPVFFFLQRWRLRFSLLLRRPKALSVESRHCFENENCNPCPVTHRMKWRGGRAGWRVPSPTSEQRWSCGEVPRGPDVPVESTIG